MAGPEEKGDLKLRASSTVSAGTEEDFSFSFAGNGDSGGSSADRGSSASIGDSGGVSGDW